MNVHAGETNQMRLGGSSFITVYRTFLYYGDSFEFHE